MKVRSIRALVWSVSLLACVAAIAGCKKQVASKPPAAAPPPAVAAPTVTLNASPDSIKPGDMSRLSWSSTSATDLDIEPAVGKVSPQGSTPVNPTQSTTYTITATGSGGTATASARVTVSAPEAAEGPARPAGMVALFEQNVKDAFFDTDKADLDADARATLTKDGEFLRTYSQVHISIEGHCDERGSTEYNLGLGQRRAAAAKNFLLSLGIAGDRVETTSWGKERPFCSDHDEACWHQNRRAHFVLAR
jgi:peptidoglycan-associated lipoprotein